MIELRNYQIPRKEAAVKALTTMGAVYLVMEPRTGKTKTAFAACEELEAKAVFFIGGKQFKDDIADQHEEVGKPFELQQFHYEQMEKLLREGYVPSRFMIIDEGHNAGAFPKPSDRALFLKELVARAIEKHGIENLVILFLSGTPSPENYCQLYHQFNILPKNPFGTIEEFLLNYVTVTDKPIWLGHGRKVNSKEYEADARSMLGLIKPYLVTCTQKEAGFQTEIIDERHPVQMAYSTYQKIYHISNHRSITIGQHRIECPTPSGLKSKIHQLCGGTIRISETPEDNRFLILDKSKAEYIKRTFEGKKIAIYYKFRAEFELLKEVFPEYTTDFKEFNQNIHLTYLKQFRSGREGVNLHSADYLVAYNIDYAAVSYRQFRERHMYWEKKEPGRVAWIFAEGGLEESIYKLVINKQDYTDRYFEEDLNIFKEKNPNQLSFF